MTLRRSLFASLTGTYINFALQVGASMILARFLSPAEMGVWSVAQGAIFVSSTLRDFGAGDYLVRSGEVNARSIGRVFGLMLCISIFCAAVLWFSRTAIADYFREPRLAGLIGLCTITYLLMPFGLGALVTLEREYAFATLQKMQIVATIVSAGLSILLAMRGWSFYALAYGQLAQAGMLLGLRAWVRPAAVFCRPVFSGWRGMLHFGSFITLNAVVGQISAQSVTVLLGRVAGLSALGIFDKAQSMGNYVSTGVIFPTMQVVYVAFSKVKEDAVELGRLFLLSLQNLTGILLPGYAVLALLAEPMVHLIYGPRWVAAAPLLSVICIGGMLFSSYNVHVRALTAVGKVQTVFAIEASMMVLRILAVFTLVRFGVFWATVGVVIPFGPAFVLYWLAMRPHIRLRRSDVFRALVGTAALTLAVAAVPLLLKPVVRTMPEVAQLAVILAASSLVWMAMVIVTNHPLKLEIMRVIGAGRRLPVPPQSMPTRLTP